MAWSNNAHVSSRTRRRILRRDQCRQVCGDAHGPFEIDHRNNTRGPGYDSDENLWTLCRVCHERKTRRETAAGFKKFVNRAKFPQESHSGLVAVSYTHLTLPTTPYV